MNSCNLIFYLAIIAIAISTVTSLSCGPCDPKACFKDTCKGGYVKDVCGCCDVCAKTEGENCGGLWDYYGKCAAGFRCVSRSKDSLNTQKQFEAGICEPDKCATIKCAAGETCAVVDDQPTCNCPTFCKRTADPVCAVTSGVEFMNVCFLKKYECKTGQSLKYESGSCRKCFYNGVMYKLGETILKKRGCQSCTCKHGSWECKSKCEDKGSIPCKMSMAFNELVCPSGMKCQIDIDLDDISKPGMCVPIEEIKSTSEAATVKEGKSIAESDKQTSSEVTDRCPVKKACRKICLAGYQQDSRGCTVCKCNRVGNSNAKKDSCKLHASRGPCANSIERWHFNSEAGECMLFYYGGCFGNSNNFITKIDCQKRCKKEKEDFKKDKCTMVPLHGPCQNKEKRWFYNAKIDRCQSFIYGGCGANANNFLTRKQCNGICRNRELPVEDTN